MPKKPKPPQRHWIQPNEVTVRASPGKGVGLFSTVELKKNSRLEYLGVIIDEEEYKQLESKRIEEGAQSKRTSYIVSSGDKGKYVDGNPDRVQNSLGARANEPSQGQKANMILIHEDKRPFLVLVEDVPPNTELTVHYGNDYDRGYKVGKRALKPEWIKRSKKDPNNPPPATPLILNAQQAPQVPQAPPPAPKKSIKPKRKPAPPGSPRQAQPPPPPAIPAPRPSSGFKAPWKPAPMYDSDSDLNFAMTVRANLFKSRY